MSQRHRTTLSEFQSFSKLPRLNLKSPSELAFTFGTLWLPSGSCQKYVRRIIRSTGENTDLPLYFMRSLNTPECGHTDCIIFCERKLLSRTRRTRCVLALFFPAVAIA